MIEFHRGNLFEAEVEALVNTVNTVGVMGKGIALQFSRQFPEIQRPYEQACKNGSLKIGTIQSIKLSLLSESHGPHYVINFPTKQHWKQCLGMNRWRRRNRWRVVSKHVSLHRKSMFASDVM